ncbi:hypothetical protein OH76DRAFT_1367079, partial [Lentinus brumalis]
MDPNVQLNNIRASYRDIRTQVDIALRAFVGDAPRLGQVRTLASSLLHAAQQQPGLMPPAEYETLRSSLQLMVSDLDDARYKSRDPPDETHLPLIQTVHTGKRGRPSQPIDRTWLEHALKLRGPARVAKALKCSARHVRREALRLGLAEPAPPVFRPVEHPDGTSTRIHTTQTAPVSTLTDAELDAILRDVLSAYPRMGHVMLRGALIARGHRVPEARLIRWKFVIHCFIDGFSRFVTAIRVHTNNRAATVLELFLEGVRTHGMPSRWRPGWRRIEVGTAAHISGAERLWFDVTIGFGGKWKTFFLELEHHDDLN